MKKKNKLKVRVTTILLLLLPVLLIGCGNNDKEILPESNDEEVLIQHEEAESPEEKPEENPNHNGVEEAKRNNILPVVHTYIEKLENVEGVESLDGELTIFEEIKSPVLDSNTDEAFSNVYSLVGSFNLDEEEHSYRIALSFKDEELEVPGKLLMYMSDMDTAHFDETVIFPEEGL